MSGLFTAAFLRQIGWDVDVYERSQRRTGRPRRRHHHASGTARRAGSERRRHARSRHRGAQAHRARPAGPRHRRAAAAADPDLVGPAAAPAARDHRSGALPSRLGRSSASSRTAAACACTSTAAASSTPTSWSAATASAPACAARSRRSCSRSMPATTSGAARRTKPISSPQTLNEIFPYFVLLSAAAPGGHHLPDLRLQRRPAARAPPLQLHLVSRGRRREARRRCTSTRTARQHEYLGAAAADPQGPDRADARRRARHHAAGDARLRDEDRAAVHHADLRLHRAAHRVRPRRHGRRRGGQRAPAHGLRRRQGGRRRAGAGRARCATTTTSTRRSRPTTPSASRSATPS